MGRAHGLPNAVQVRLAADPARRAVCAVDRQGHGSRQGRAPQPTKPSTPAASCPPIDRDSSKPARIIATRYGGCSDGIQISLGAAAAHRLGSRVESPYTAASNLGVAVHVHRSRVASLLALALATLLLAARARAARECRSAWAFPSRRAGLPTSRSATGRSTIATGEGQNIRVTVLTKALAFPFTLTFLPDGTMLVTQRDGKLRVHAQRQARPESRRRRSGVVLDGHVGTAGRRARLHGYRAASAVRAEPNALLELHETARRQPHDVRRRARPLDRQRAQPSSRTSSSPSRATAARRRSRSAATACSTSRRAAATRKTHDNLGGKVLRLRDDGSVPNDNPFVGKQGYRPEIYTLGHRNSLGLALHPARARSGRARTARTAATRSTSSAPARTTAGRS